MADNTTYSLFIERYMIKLPLDFKWQKTPVQIYSLEFLSQYLKLPTPLLRADYNFLVILNSGKYNQQIGVEDYEINAPSLIPILKLLGFKSYKKKGKKYWEKNTGPNIVL